MRRPEGTDVGAEVGELRVGLEAARAFVAELDTEHSRFLGPEGTHLRPWTDDRRLKDLERERRRLQLRRGDVRGAVRGDAGRGLEPR